MTCIRNGFRWASSQASVQSGMTTKGMLDAMSLLYLASKTAASLTDMDGSSVELDAVVKPGFDNVAHDGSSKHSSVLRGSG
jgi:hypothetical protein